MSYGELLERSDIVSMHAPGTKDAHHLMKEQHFKKMKKTALFVNTGRGSTVDEAAMIKALQEGWIAGAGLDVMEVEPIGHNNPLLGMDNVILTAHVASASSRCRWVSVIGLPVKGVEGPVARDESAESIGSARGTATHSNAGRVRDHSVATDASGCDGSDGTVGSSRPSSSTTKPPGCAAASLANGHEPERSMRSPSIVVALLLMNPIALAQVLSAEGGVVDPSVLCAAVLHDTIEDTETSEAELVAAFGAKIASIVLEVTDDKTLAKSDRKERQIERAAHLAELVRAGERREGPRQERARLHRAVLQRDLRRPPRRAGAGVEGDPRAPRVSADRKSTRLNSSHSSVSRMPSSA